MLGTHTRSCSRNNKGDLRAGATGRRPLLGVPNLLTSVLQCFAEHRFHWHPGLGASCSLLSAPRGALHGSFGLLARNLPDPAVDAHHHLKDQAQ